MRTRRWAPVLLYMAGLFVLSSIQSPPALPGRTDKPIHAALYSGLGAVSLRALAGGRWEEVTLARAFGAVAIASGYGAFDEYHQSFVPGRQSEVADLIADAMGAAIAAVGLWVWGILFQKKQDRNTEY